MCNYWYNQCHKKYYGGAWCISFLNNLCFAKIFLCIYPTLPTHPSPCFLKPDKQVQRYPPSVLSQTWLSGLQALVWLERHSLISDNRNKHWTWTFFLLMLHGFLQVSCINVALYSVIISVFKKSCNDALQWFTFTFIINFVISRRTFRTDIRSSQ